MNIDLTPVFQAVIALLAALVTYKLIPWIKARTTESQQASIRAAVKVAVFSAEQIYGAGNGKEKLEFAREKLRAQGFDVDTDEIEAIVGEYLNGGVTINSLNAQEGFTLPPVDEWPLETIAQFCRINSIPCEGCETKEDYIRAITQNVDEKLTGEEGTEETED